MSPTSATPDPSEAAPHRVLVVDDDELLRETVKEILETEGFAVATAENGQDALDRIVFDGTPCFVLLDLMMPVMDGTAFLEKVRREGGSTMPIVVFSALTEAASLAAHYGCGVLPKPASFDQLVATAERYCPRVA